MSKKKSTIDDVLAAVKSGFGDIDKRFETIDRRFETIDKRFETIDKRFNDVEIRFDRRFNNIDIRLDTLTTSVNDLASKVKSYLGQEWNVHIHGSHPRLEKRIKVVERKLGIKSI